MMDTDPLQRELFVRYYLWAMRQAEAEVEQGLPTVRAIRSISTAKLKEQLHGLSQAKQTQMLQAMVKRLYPHAAAILGLTLSDEERQFCGKFLKSQTLLPEIQAYYQRVQQRDRSLVFNKRALLSLINREMGLTLGTRHGPTGGPLWAYEMRHGRWIILTNIDVGGSACRLYYSHNLAMQDEPHRYLLSGISALAWLGINASCWQFHQSSEMNEMVKTLKRCCLQFLEAVPLLLEGL